MRVVIWMVFSSEESDADVCYATPPNLRKGKCVAELFNVNTPGKDIKWKVGLIFTDKQQLKNVVRSSSMESGRPYHYIVDDLKRVQVGCSIWIILLASKAKRSINATGDGSRRLIYLSTLGMGTNPSKTWLG